MRTTPRLDSDLTSKRWNASLARRVLARWRKSGATLAAFARKHGVSAQRLSWWQKRLGCSGEGTRAVGPLAFIPAVVTPSPVVRAGGRIVVRLPGGVELEEEAGGMPAAWVAELAREIGSVAR
jgi:transposase-like protein